jgi:hypothetical protein
MGRKTFPYGHLGYVGEAMGATVAEILVAERDLEHPVRDARATLSSAELAECTCPEWCERDHDLD